MHLFLAQVIRETQELEGLHIRGLTEFHLTRIAAYNHIPDHLRPRRCHAWPQTCLSVFIGTLNPPFGWRKGTILNRFDAMGISWNPLSRKLNTLIESAFFAYGMLFLVQLKIVWGMWRFKDLPFGDTSYYFVNAYRWFEAFSVNMISSPLYTAFYGTLLFFSKDVYLITILHRLIIVFVVTLLVFSLMRKILPQALAWMMTVWWAVLPINFLTLYEVHLFAVIPILAAWIVAFYFPSGWSRGTVLAILVGTAILVRNELVVSVVVFSVCCIGWELYGFKKMSITTGTQIRLSAKHYVLPLCVSFMFCIFFYMRSEVTLPNLSGALHEKHTLNMCQTYAFGHLQRHPDWGKDPWLQCNDLMKETFGKERPTFKEMVFANPSAVLQHVLWNVRLIPAGLQVLLFSATSFSTNPDYAFVSLNLKYPLVLSFIVGTILLWGITVLYRQKRWWWSNWFQRRAFGWLSMMAVVSFILPVMLTQRPRTSYLFSLSIFLLAFTGSCLHAISEKFVFSKKPIKGSPKLMALMMAFTLLVDPGLTTVYSLSGLKPSRPLHDAYRRLVPYQEIISSSDTVFVAGRHAAEIGNYIGHGKPAVFEYAILSEREPDEPLEDFLNRRGVNLFYVNERLWRELHVHPVDKNFLLDPVSRGWKVVGSGDQEDLKWMLLEKDPSLS
jgi:hypothetical protein